MSPSAPSPLFRAEPTSLQPTVDVHVHLGPSDTGELYYPTLTGDEFLGLMDAVGLETACAFAPQRANYRRANADLREFAARSGGRVRAFARLGGRRAALPAYQPWMVRRALRSRLPPYRQPDLDTDPDGGIDADLDGYAGIKLLPHLDGLPSRATFAAIARRRLPVLVHGGVHVPPRWIEKHLVPAVGGPLIVAHLGAFPCAAPLVREAIELARRHAHVYLDTSGVWLAEFLRFAAQEVPDKLLFGSDAPLAHPGVAWQHLASVVHDEDLLRRIGGGTARSLLPLDSSPQDRP